MLKLVENDVNISDGNCENRFGQLEEQKRASRKRYLEITLEQEREEALQLKKRMEKEKEEMIISVVLIVCSLMLFGYLGTHALSVVMSLVSRPVLEILILGGIIKFVSYTVEYARKHIPMYIWCEQERKGKEPNHDNYVRQYNNKTQMCKQMEKELNELNGQM